MGQTKLTVEQRAAMVELHKRRLKDDIIYFAEHAVKIIEKPGENFSPAPCHKLLLHKLSKVADGSSKKLMVFMPSGSAKSTYLSQIFPAYLMSTRPKVEIVAASNVISFAEFQSERVQQIMTEFQNELSCVPLTQNKSFWTASNGSTYKAAGVGSAIMGRRADFFIIDDPFAGFDDASSPSQRDTVDRWFQADVQSRLKPGGAIILMHQRLHLDDLAGRLLDREKDEWDVLFLPAIWESEKPEPKWPKGLGRKQGELLWPEYHSQEFLDGKRRGSTATIFASMYQQQPIPEGGVLFKTALIGKIRSEDVLSGGRTIRAWDLAGATSAKADWTVGLKMRRNINDTYTILDMVRFKGGPEEVEQRVRAVAEADGYEVEISVPQDAGQAGKHQAAAYLRRLAGFNVEASQENTKIGRGKEGRAMPFAAMANSGNVYLVTAPWNQDYLAELETFPSGRHDDAVDASSRAFNLLAVNGPAYRRPAWSRMNVLGR